jgi:glycosyltransferase involved in cell wall biosynthesis
MVRSVLVLHHIAGGVGGAERYLELLAGQLAPRDVRADLLVFGPEPFASDAVSRIGPAFASAGARPGRFRPLAVARAIRTRRPDVLHWNLSDPFAFSGAAWLLVPWGVPSVVTDHLPMLRAGPHREIPRSLANRVARALIVVGPASAEAARGHWGPLPQLRTIPNGVPVPPTPARTDRDPTQPLRLLVLGRLEPQKAPRFALEVLQALVAAGHDAELRYVGAGSLQAELQRDAARLGLADRVVLVGFQPDPGPELAGADILLVPSLFESAVPLVAREALAAGLPVVLSDIPAHRELLPGSAAVVVAPVGDVAAWTTAAARIAADWSAASRQARRIGETFDVATMAERTVDAYRDAVRGPARRRGAAGRA